MVVDLCLSEAFSYVLELCFVVKGEQSLIWEVHVVTESLGHLHVKLMHEPAVIAPLAELLDVVVSTFGELLRSLAWAACTSIGPQHDVLI